MKSDYFERKEQRIERFKELIAKNEQLSVSLYNHAQKMASVIPFGQPILVGHHSESRDRNYRSKIHNTFGKSFEASDKAKYYEERVSAAESNHAISSDNPDAIKLLTEKLEHCQAAQETWKSINKIVKKNIADVEKVEQLMKLGMKEQTAIQLITPDPVFYGRVGIPSFRLTNNNANMKRIKDRISHLKNVESFGEKEIEIGEVKILASSETNRVQIFFPGKPAEEVRTDLKGAGFRWAPTENAWQKNLSNWAIDQAQGIVKKHYQKEPA